MRDLRRWDLCARRAAAVVVFAVLGLGVFAAGGAAEQASEPTLAVSGGLDAGAYDTCSLLSDAGVRCWGFAGDGQLGYGTTDAIGDDETPASIGPVNLGQGRTAKAVTAGDYHTCALLDNGRVRCWGFGAQGRLGYGNTDNIGDDEAPGSVAPVDLGPMRTAKAISAGGAHTCAVLDNGSVRCWGFGASGQLGYGNQSTIGDNETPGSAAPVDLGPRRTAKAISAGGRHTCALLDDDTVRCWGFAAFGQLGYGDTGNVGDDESPGSVSPVNLGPNRKAKAISAGDYHTCAVLDDGTVRCWGSAGNGRLGYGQVENIGDDETPDTAGPVDLGVGRIATAVSAGGSHTCALLDDGSVRCWGYNAKGQLGYANTSNIGDDETPGSAGRLDLGPGRRALAISAGQHHTCARLDDGSLRCWGYAGNGRLGYCNPNDVGDDEPPAAAGPVNLERGDRGVLCPASPLGGPANVASLPASGPTTTLQVPSPDAVRARGLRRCLAAVTAHAKREQRRPGRRSSRRRAGAMRHPIRHAASGRRRCLRLYGRTPGPVTGVRARALGKTQIELSFNAPGTDGSRPPPARSYVVTQSLRPIRTARGFARAKTLCNRACRFTVDRIGDKVSLTVTNLRRHATYYYAVAARDNVSGHRGPIGRTVKATTG